MQCAKNKSITACLHTINCHTSYHLINLADRQSDGLKTPLMLAAWRQHYKCVEALIAFQANPDLKDMHGGAACLVAARDVRVDVYHLNLNHGAGFTAIGHSHKVHNPSTSFSSPACLKLCFHHLSRDLSRTTV